MALSKRKVHYLQSEIQLELDLLFASPALPMAKVIPFKSPNGTDERSEWTDEEVYTLRRYMLRYTFRHLADLRASQSTKAEMAKWVASDEIAPFSFTVCASECGYNAYALRERLMDLLRRLGFCWQ